MVINIQGVVGIPHLEPPVSAGGLMIIERREKKQ